VFASLTSSNENKKSPGLSPEGFFILVETLGIEPRSESNLSPESTCVSSSFD
jgi:hypothetical protein